jgi:hypothetical protein
MEFVLEVSEKEKWVINQAVYCRYRAPEGER